MSIAKSGAKRHFFRVKEQRYRLVLLVGQSGWRVTYFLGLFFRAQAGSVLSDCDFDCSVFFCLVFSKIDFFCRIVEQTIL